MFGPIRSATPVSARSSSRSIERPRESSRKRPLVSPRRTPRNLRVLTRRCGSELRPADVTLVREVKDKERVVAVEHRDARVVNFGST